MTLGGRDEFGAPPGGQDLPWLSARIAKAFVRRKAVNAEVLPALILQIYGVLAGLGERPAAATERPKPAVPIGRSVQRDYIVCLEDGKRLKMLKRHLRARYGMTPDDYRRRWGLAPDYPMVAPAYAQRRSDFAKQIGLGRNRRAAG